MFRKYFFSVIAVMAALTAGADTVNLRNLFVEMPDTVIPYLSRNNRLDFVDFMDSNMKAEVTNALGGKSVMTALADDSISISLSEATKVDLLLLTVAEPVDSTKQVICLIQTVGPRDGYQESVVKYFSLNWQTLSYVPKLSVTEQKRISGLIKTSSILKMYSKKLNKL